MKDSSIPIINFDEIITGSSHTKSKNGVLLPHNARILLIGKSNSGKTNAVLNLIFHRNGIKFKNLYLYSGSVYQQKYEFLKRVFSKIKCVKFHMCANSDLIPEVNKVEKNSFVIFDDLQLTRVPQIRQFFTYGRHKDIDVAYLVQGYGCISKHHIRDSANIVLIFKLDYLNLHLIYRDFSESDMSFPQFREMCLKVWSNGKHNFLSIFNECDLENGKYRQNLDQFLKVG